MTVAFALNDSLPTPGRLGQRDALRDHARWPTHQPMAQHQARLTTFQAGRRVCSLLHVRPLRGRQRCP